MRSWLSGLICGLCWVWFNRDWGKCLQVFDIAKIALLLKRSIFFTLAASNCLISIIHVICVSLSNEGETAIFWLELLAVRWMKYSKPWHISDNNKWSALIADCMSFQRVRTFLLPAKTARLGANRITFRYWFISALFICLSGRFDSCVLTFVKVTHLPPGWPQSQSLKTGIRTNSIAVVLKWQISLLW